MHAFPCAVCTFGNGIHNFKQGAQKNNRQDKGRRYRFVQNTKIGTHTRRMLVACSCLHRRCFKKKLSRASPDKRPRTEDARKKRQKYPSHPELFTYLSAGGVPSTVVLRELVDLPQLLTDFPLRPDKKGRQANRQQYGPERSPLTYTAICPRYSPNVVPAASLSHHRI